MRTFLLAKCYGTQDHLYILDAELLPLNSLVPLAQELLVFLSSAYFCEFGLQDGYQNSNTRHQW